MRAQRYEAEHHYRVTTHSRDQKQHVQSIREVSQEQEAQDERTLHDYGAEKSYLEIPLAAVDARQRRYPDCIQVCILHH